MQPSGLNLTYIRDTATWELSLILVPLNCDCLGHGLSLGSRKAEVLPGPEVTRHSQLRNVPVVHVSGLN